MYKLFKFYYYESRDLVFSFLVFLFFWFWWFFSYKLSLEIIDVHCSIGFIHQGGGSRGLQGWSLWQTPNPKRREEVLWAAPGKRSSPCSPWRSPYWGRLSLSSPCWNNLEKISTCSLWRILQHSKWTCPEGSCGQWRSAHAEADFWQELCLMGNSY